MSERQRDERKRGEIAIYKPNPKKTGSVAQFKLGHQNDCMFLEIAPQLKEGGTDKRPFDWEKKIIVKLGETDICKFLAYIGLNRPGAALKIYHESPDGGNKGIEFKWQEYKGRPSYYMKVSHQKNKGAQATSVAIPIALDEIEFLKVGFRKALEVILDWDTPVQD